MDVASSLAGFRFAAPGVKGIVSFSSFRLIEVKGRASRLSAAWVR
jgi:hypothetical protein